MEVQRACYCGTYPQDTDSLQCQRCGTCIHLGCLKSGQPSPLLGDLFFQLICAQCGEDGEEEICRMKLQWLQVVMLTLYNLQLSGSGKCGYYRWKEHICSFIDKHWNTFFGAARKKTSTWFGTVAGTLSSGCPQYFKSGAAELKESGWWSLAENKPPSVDTLNAGKPIRRQKAEIREPSMKMEGLRTRRCKTSFQAAMELKAKRAMTQEAKDIRKAKGRVSSSSTSRSTSPGVASVSTEMLDRSLDSTSLDTSECSFLSASSDTSKRHSLEADMLDQDSCTSMSSVKSDHWLTERDLKVGDRIPQCLMEGEDDPVLDSDFEVDPCSITPPDQPGSPSGLGSSAGDCLPRMEDILATLDRKIKVPGETYEDNRHGHNSGDTGPLKTLLDRIKSEPQSEESCSTDMLANNTVLSDPALDQQDNEQNSMEEKPQLPGDGEAQGQGEGQDSDGEASSSESEAGDSQTTETSDGTEELIRRKRRGRAEGEQDLEPKPPEPKYMAMSLYEERQLLKKLNNLGSMVESNPESNRLKRKLIVRQVKRERGVPLFNIDAEMKRLTASRMLHTYKENIESSLQDYDHKLNPHGVTTSRFTRGDFRVLDRFQMSCHTGIRYFQPVSFLNRLVGTEDDQLQSIRSPYTTRMLKPFIRRDYESHPLKMKLLMEIQEKYKSSKSDPDWMPPTPAPIDYCYVRPQHIPSVNALCREFFWPGIDLSECLQYPDFSCVVLYSIVLYNTAGRERPVTDDRGLDSRDPRTRKFVIGFAFMVPDVKYNEAYISFIFTHPEWRGAGIGTFMLYHLIQTCMGKDVTLHVSASNPAMLLYQRFGFKPEEFILDFYDKYFPVESTECRHAFLVRLRR